jgi:hypothetical protein
MSGMFRAENGGERAAKDYGAIGRRAANANAFAHYHRRIAHSACAANHGRQYQARLCPASRLMGKTGVEATYLDVTFLGRLSR